MRRLISNPWFQICAVIAVVSAVLTVRNQIVFSAYFGKTQAPPDVPAANPGTTAANPAASFPLEKPAANEESSTPIPPKEDSIGKAQPKLSVAEPVRNPVGRAREETPPVRAASPGGVKEFETGMKFYEGIGAPKNFRLAITYLQQAAETGHTRAMTKLGWMYWFGEGVEPDAAAGARWYQRSARAGDAEAQYWLAIFYDKGYGGLQKSRPQALEWMRKSAQQGYSEAVKATRPGGAFAP